MFEKSKQGAVTIIGGDDPLTSDHADAVTELFEECLDEGQPMAVLDMGRMPLIDSRGLEMLLDVRENFEQRGGSLKLAAPNPLCRDALTLAGITDHLEVFDETNEAVRSFLK